MLPSLLAGPPDQLEPVGEDLGQGPRSLQALQRQGGIVVESGGDHEHEKVLHQVRLGLRHVLHCGLDERPHHLVHLAPAREQDDVHELGGRVLLRLRHVRLFCSQGLLGNVERLAQAVRVLALHEKVRAARDVVVHGDEAILKVLQGPVIHGRNQVRPDRPQVLGDRRGAVREVGQDLQDLLVDVLAFECGHLCQHGQQDGLERHEDVRHVADRFQDSPDRPQAPHCCEGPHAVVVLPLFLALQQLPESRHQVLAQAHRERADLVPELLHDGLQRAHQVFVLHFTHELEELVQQRGEDGPEGLQAIHRLHEAPQRHNPVHLHRQLRVLEAPHGELHQRNEVLALPPPLRELDVRKLAGYPASLGPKVSGRVAVERGHIAHQHLLQLLLVGLGALQLVADGADR
mmetsp:Transcript_21062/g.59254  ORF Transcript_21062/g.59254 Transcript_21062/m.59254 type:complete len:403 (+) Transcript_21062:635-1843(+)